MRGRHPARGRARAARRRRRRRCPARPLLSAGCAAGNGRRTALPAGCFFELAITTRLGVVADTHVPDRLRSLPPGLLQALAGVDAILHAGDVTQAGVLADLAAIAPVFAVAGNRDFRLGLPLDRVLEYDGVRLGLTHGHGGWLGYLQEKLFYVTVGYHLSRYVRRVRARFPGQAVSAIVFGHSHRMVNTVVDDVLLFNPGSIAPDYHAPFHRPAVGLLTIADGQVRGEVVPLPG